MRAIRAKVIGLVQGVWFRASTADVARRLGLAGTVENVPDDAVLVVAEGEAAAIDALVAWLHQGPPQARVERVELEDVAVEGRADFTILR